MNRIIGKRRCQWQCMPRTTRSIARTRWHYSLPTMVITRELIGQLPSPCGVLLLWPTFNGWQVFISSIVKDWKHPVKQWESTMIRKPNLLQYTSKAIWLCYMGKTWKPGHQHEGWMPNSMVHLMSWRLCHPQHFGSNYPDDGKYGLPLGYLELSSSASLAIRFEIHRIWMPCLQMNIIRDMMSKDVNTRQDMR